MDTVEVVGQAIVGSLTRPHAWSMYPTVVTVLLVVAHHARRRGTSGDRIHDRHVILQE